MVTRGQAVIRKFDYNLTMQLTAVHVQKIAFLDFQDSFHFLCLYEFSLPEVLNVRSGLHKLKFLGWILKLL